MKLDPLGLDPVAIALDRIEVQGDVRFSGLDLDSGGRVIVTIVREEASEPLAETTADAAGLVLVLTLGSPAGAA